MQTQEKTPELEPQAPKTQTPAKPLPRRIPFWASLSIAVNGLLLLSMALAYWKPSWFGLTAAVDAPATTEITANGADTAPPSGPEADRKSLTYAQWLEILGKEAKATAQSKPERLTVLLGDSLSLWFPAELLPVDRNWLNQGISGESAAGLFKRLNLLDGLQPQTLMVMVGVNDLIKGESDEQVLDHYRQIIQNLKQKHPESEIVMQSILPHGGDRLTVEDREQVLKISNERIYQLNLKLKELAKQSEVNFLNLHPLFVDDDGLLREKLATDGLHLSEEGYMVWRSAFQILDQLVLKPPVAKTAVKPAATPEANAAEAPVEPQPEAPAEPQPGAPAEPKAEAREKPAPNATSESPKSDR
jgi:lysophospholipase L1-like esterase